MRTDTALVEFLAAEAAKHGFRLESHTVTSGTHRRLEFLHPSGAKAVKVVPNSGQSKGRIWLNARSQLRRLMSEALITPRPAR